MKKLFATVLALVLCLSVLGIAAMAAPTLSTVSVTGTHNEWKPEAEAGRMELVSENVYKITFTAWEAGDHEFKFTANGNWDDLNLGGTYMGSGVSADAYWNSGNIKLTLTEAQDVTIVLDLTAFDFDTKQGAKFTVTVGTQIDDPVPNIKIHVVAPADWTDVYVYSFNPQSAGNWPGTKVENFLEIPAAFEGLVVSNGAGVQTVDIKDVDLTKSEVWILLGDADDSGKLSYTLSYTDPNNSDTGDAIAVVLSLLVVSGAGICVLGKKKEF